MKSICVLILTGGVLATPASQQAKPDFSGSWAIAAPSPMIAKSPNGVFFGGPEFTATQDKLTLVLVRAKQTPAPTKFVVNLHGSVSKNRLEIGGQVRDTLTQATWHDAKLVLVTTYTVGERDVEHKQTLYFDRSGTLVVEQSTGSKTAKSETQSSWEWTYKQK